MPKITIDGEEIEVPQGSTVLQAALSVGREIPHFCYHPGLSIAGNCRMCLVEMEKAPKLVIGCGTYVQDGMVIRTQTEKVKEAQAAVMEFQLINHPLDCPICDQAGECRLQEHAVDHGTGVSRYTEQKNHNRKAVDIGEHVLLDQERCIQCSRCIRFCDEITQTGELAFFRRGERSMIGIWPGKRLDNAYSGNVVDICPVGALTLKDFRFATRVWYIKNTPSVCAGCSRGCNVVIGVGKQRELMTTEGQQDDRIKRVVPRVNEAVNAHWICDEGRLSYQRVENATRLRTAESPPGSELDWDVAVKRAAEALKESAAAARVAAILSPRLTNETLYAWSELFGGLGQVRVGVRSLVRGEDDDVLIRADKGANSTGAAWIFGENASEVSVLDAVAAGEIDTLLIAGDTLDPADTAHLDEASLAKVRNLIYVGPFVDATAKTSSLLLPATAWSEEDGTLVNFEGRIQRVRRAHLPRSESRPGWRVVADIGIAAGFDPPGWSSSSDVLAALAEKLREFEGLTEERIGMLGVQGAAATPARG
jgi:NADH-quinone oxidoreductase subunit G